MERDDASVVSAVTVLPPDKPTATVMIPGLPDHLPYHPPGDKVPGLHGHFSIGSPLQQDKRRPWILNDI